MNYETAMIKLRGEVCSGVKLGLQNIKNLMEKLGNPQDKLKIIHIAGTNGKGSCTSFVNSVLVSQGYKVGMFTSPSIYNFEERIRINNKNISEDKLIELMNEVRKIANTLEVFPADFELVTAVAFLYFYREKCDFAIMEVGLGGRLDATNVVDKPLITLITSISFDHQQFLGNTIKEISLANSFSSYSFILLPFNKISPLLIEFIPFIVFKRVVLPEPLGPIIPIISSD